MFRFFYRQQQQHNEGRRRLVLVRYGEDSITRNLVANRTLVEAVPITEEANSGRRALSATPNPEPNRRRRRRLCPCGHSDQEIVVQSRVPTRRGGNAIPMVQAQILDTVLVDRRRNVASIVVASTPDSAQSRSSGGQSQADSSAVDHEEQSHRDRLGVLPRLPLSHDLHSRTRDSEGRSREGGRHSRLTSLAEILMLQGALAIGLPMDDYESQSNNSSINILENDILPGYATATRPNEVSCMTNPSSSEHSRAVSEVTLPVELRGGQTTPVEDDIGFTDLQRRGSFSMEDYLDDKKLEELVADFNAIHTKQIDQMKRETAAFESILRSVNDKPKGKSIQSLSSDSSELVNLMQEQYEALELLKEAQAPSSSVPSHVGKKGSTTNSSDGHQSFTSFSTMDFDEASPNTTPRTSNIFMKAEL